MNWWSMRSAVENARHFKENDRPRDDGKNEEQQQDDFGDCAQRSQQCLSYRVGTLVYTLSCSHEHSARLPWSLTNVAETGRLDRYRPGF